jgi:hypothetical protein
MIFHEIIKEGRNNMKKTVCTLFCFTVVFCFFPVTAFAEDFSARAISVFQEFQKANSEFMALFLSGDNEDRAEKGKMLDIKKEEYSKILKSLPEEYCADPQIDLLREFIKTLISTSSSADESPTYVFAELYSCDPDRIIKEILSMTLEDQLVVYDALDWGFKNITYKVESLPDYKDLVDKLNGLKNTIRDNKKSD